MRLNMFYLSLSALFFSCGSKLPPRESMTQTEYAACKKPNRSPVNIDSYYQSAKGKDGDNLKSALNNIIKNHQAYSYNKCLKKIIQESDRHPQSSNHVLGFYSQKQLHKSKGWNKEHVWAKSHGFRKSSAHAYSDAHHLRATLNKNNSHRGNKDFGYGGEPIGNICPGCLKTPSTWEAPDAVKGDVARMMFYMATRYEGNDQSRTQDLELVRGTTGINQPKFGDICTLLEWNRLDPVSNEEMHRNIVVYEWQGNRNPYIDFPEWADKVWGSKFNCNTAE